MPEVVSYGFRWGGFCKRVRDSSRVTRTYRLQVRGGRLHWDHITTSYAWWADELA